MGIKDRYFIIVDEVGELNPAEAVTKEEKLLKQQCQTIMSKIARIGAGLGFRQILATQYPTGDVIPRQCKQNSDAKLSFRVQSAIASRVVLDESVLNYFHRYQVGPFIKLLIKEKFYKHHL